ncbi:MAG TPA: single-stranded DNA-binding protein [Acidobacteriota bacterium]|nr:single-stranded DNA-binding protein [Acidobacteriota bacterium]
MRDINSYNKVILVGRLGADPEVRYIPQSNRPVANYSLATNERVFNPQTKESQDRTEWHKIVSWGKTAEFCEKYLSKGKQILVEGRLRTDKWEDRNGNPRYTTKIHAYQVTLLGKRGDTETIQSPPDFDDESNFPSDQNMPDADSEDEDVPF